MQKREKYLKEKWPGVAIWTQTQFSGDSWLPAAYGSYVYCAHEAYRAYIDMPSAESAERNNIPGWPRLGPAYMHEAEAFDMFLPLPDEKRWPEGIVHEWFETYENERDPLDERVTLTMLLSMLSGRNYTCIHGPYVNESEDCVRTVFYPAEMYTEWQLQDECFPEYMRLKQLEDAEYERTWAELQAKMIKRLDEHRSLFGGED